MSKLRQLDRNVHCIVGVPLDMVTMSEALDIVASATSTRKRLFVSTVNMNFVAQAQRDIAFRDSVIASDLCLTDGIAVKLIGRLLGLPIEERVAGSDILSAIWERPVTAGAKPLKVFLFGGTEEANAEAAEAINLRAPEKIVCVGNFCPGFGSVEDMSTCTVIEAINCAKPDFLIVALGAQKGQAWIMHNMGKLEVPVISHLGATINFLAGTLRRAPPGWQKLGLEWLWRIKEEPNLAGRYLRDGLILLRLLVTKIGPTSIWSSWSKWRWRSTGFSVNAAPSLAGQAKLILKGNLTAAHWAEIKQAVVSLLDQKPPLILDLSAANWIDTRVMGSLLVLSQRVGKNDGFLRIEGAPRNLRWALRLNGLGDLLSE